MSETQKTLFIDQDNVLAAFDLSPMFKQGDEYKNNPPRMYERYFFETLPVVKGALWAVRTLMPHYDIHILTQPVKETHYSYSEKAAWVWKWFPELGGKVHMSQKKEFLSGRNRILIDDNLKWWEPWEMNGGQFVHFKYDLETPENNRKQWELIVEQLLKHGGK